MMNSRFIVLLLFSVLAFSVFPVRAVGYDEEIETAVDTLGAKDSSARYMTYAEMMEFLSGSVEMTDSLALAMDRQVEKNRARKVSGYRLRIYFDNSQNAREVSGQIADTFAVRYPDVPVFRIYDNPYFKVTVGEFRSKSDAMRFMEAIRPEYPTVFLVKESFSTI